jgi:hypothetical protein
VSEEKNYWLEAVKDSGTDLTLEKLEQSAKRLLDDMSKPDTFTEFKCKLCGKTDVENDSFMHTRFRTLENGIFACCNSCLLTGLG